MALTHNIENIVKNTGLSEDELARLIITKENEGLTNDEIVDLLVSISDNNEYASKDQNELQALQSLGLKPAVEKQAQDDPGLFDRFKSLVASDKEAKEQRNAAARAAIANNVSDWRDSHPEQWRVGMVNSIFGDNNMLSQYYAAKQADEVNEKNRESQREYNEYLKEYDRANAEAEKRSAYQKELKEAEAKMAELNRDLVKANPTDAAVILKQQEALIAKYPDLTNSNETAVEKQKEEEAYQAKKLDFRSKIPTVFADENAKIAQIASIMASDLRLQDKEDLVKEIQATKSTAQLARESSQSAVASHAGKKTGESLDDKDITQKANDAIKNNISPARLKQEERDKIREMGYTWTTNGWSKR